MGSGETKSGKFARIGECLYRYQPNGVYYAVIRHQGKIFRRSLKTTNLAQAKRNLADERVKITRVNVNAGKITLAALCDEYMATLSQSPKTLEDKETFVKRIKADWPRPEGAECQIRKIRPADVRKWLALYSLEPSYYNGHLWFIRAVFDYAIENKLMSDNPAASIKAKKRDKPIRRTPTMEQFWKIVGFIRTLKYYARREESADLVEFMGLAGVGNAEAANLTWGDIDFDAGTITLFRKKTRQGFQIPLYPQVRPLLERRKGDKEHEPDKRVFTIRSANKAIKSACARLGYPPFDHRSFRRMFITNAIEKGVDVKVIAEWQGHVDGGKLILDTYSHVRRPHHDKMAELLTAD